MNIIVCVKGVPTSGRQPVVTGEGAGIAADGDCFINGSDEYALEKALLFKRSLNAKVVAITVGGMKSQDIMHVAIAKGVDDAIRIDSEESDPNVIAFLLASAIRKLEHDLILTGVESADGMASQVPVTLAAQLGIPYVYAVTKIELEEGKPAAVTRELGGGRYQQLDVQLPALLCTQSGIAELTYAPTVKLIHARRRGVPAQTLESLGVAKADIARRRPAKVVDIRPVEKSGNTQWLNGSVAQLAQQIMAKIKEAR